jgi:hypothetical protein
MAPCWSQPDFVAYAFQISNLTEKVGIWGYFFCLHIYVVKVSLDGLLPFQFLLAMEMFLFNNT